MRFNSIRFKIGVLYTAILGVLLMINSVILYVTIHYNLYRELDNELRNKAQEINRAIDFYLEVMGEDEQALAIAAAKVILQDAGRPEPVRRLRLLDERWRDRYDRLGLINDYVNVLDAGGKPIAVSKSLSGGPDNLFLKSGRRAEEKRKAVFDEVRRRRLNLRIISVPASGRRAGKYVIQVGTSAEAIANILRKKIYSILISIPTIVLVTSFLGQLLVGRMLRPVMEIARTAKGITHADLSARVKAEDVEQEMKYLVDAFNEMISRLDSSFKYIMDFSSHVAHELKTPLAIIRGESEIALRKERTPEEYQRVIGVTLEETRRMLKTIEDLLLLARLDYRTDVFEFREIDLRDFLKEIFEQGKLLAGQRGGNLNLETPATPVIVRGDGLHLRRLFFNLLDNALKFTPAGGRIDLVLKSDGRQAEVAVADTGMGIDEKYLPKIFNRFFHIEKKGQAAEPGTGLGLSIALSIARMHSGGIEAKSQPGKGSVFTVKLPLAHQSSSPAGTPSGKRSQY